MAYDIQLAEKIRIYLSANTNKKIEEKKMFAGLAFMVNEKMCVCASGDKLMCRFDATIEEKVSKKKGYEPMIMGSRKYKGYCYVQKAGYSSKKDFAYLLELCLAYNDEAKSSKKK